MSSDKNSPDNMLASEQKQIASDIFARYNISKLTKNKATVIFERLENAGIRGLGIS